MAGVNGGSVTRDWSDEDIRAALKEAHLPTLAVALVHLSGDVSHLREGVKPVYEVFGDGQGDFPDAYQEQLRALAFEAITALRDNDQMAAPPSDDTLREMMDFVAGDAIPEHYVTFLMHELDVQGEGSDIDHWADEIPASVKSEFPVLIVGAGMSGILAAIRLKQAGLPYTIIEKNSSAGGTWFENTYPGCRVDSSNHMYSYSFEPNYTWPQHFSTQDVLYKYFRDCAKRYGITEHIQFETSVDSVCYDDAAKSWQVNVTRKDGTKDVLDAKSVISAVGQLNQPKYPDIPELDSFEGESFHSARWNHDFDLTGKRVAVIGTGASAFQFVPEIAEQVGEMYVFQRSAPWLAPTENYHDDVPAGMNWLLEHIPYYEKWYRFYLFWTAVDGILPACKVDPNWKGSNISISQENEEVRQMFVDYISAQVAEDPHLAKAAIPDYPIGGKRMLRDNGVWLGALKRDDVHLITDPIKEVTPTGIVTQDGRKMDVDVIIYGTGFHASRFLSPMSVKGKGGVDLNEIWNGDARAYLGITIPEFPNFFCMYGPNTNIVVNGSIIFFSECEIQYITQCLKEILSNDLQTINCKQDVHDAFNEKIDAGNKEMAWGLPDAKSWYKNDKGRVAQNWPFALVDYWNATRKVDRADYEFE